MEQFYRNLFTIRLNFDLDSLIKSDLTYLVWASLGFAERCCMRGSLGGRQKLKVHAVSSGVPLGTVLLGREKERVLGLSSLSHLLCVLRPHPPRYNGYRNTERKNKDWVLSFWVLYGPLRIHYKLWILFPRKMQIHKEFYIQFKGTHRLRNSHGP